MSRRVGRVERPTDRSGRSRALRWLPMPVAGCLAATLVAVAPSASASAGKTTHVTAAATPGTALVSSRLLVSGTAVPALPRTGLSVQRLDLGRWRTVAHVRESARGAYSVSIAAPAKPGTVVLRVIRAATGVVRAGVSPTLRVHVVTKAFTVSAQAPARVLEGAAIVVTGRVSPAVAGTVTLQALQKGRWVRATSSRLTASRFSLVAREPVGSYRLRVVSPMTTTRAAGTSATLSAVVVPQHTVADPPTTSPTPPAPTPAPPTPPTATPTPTPPTTTRPTSTPPTTRPPTATVPGTPTVGVTVGTTSATVHWTAPANGGAAITGYTVSRDGTDTGGYGAYTTTVAANVLSWTFDQLKTGEPYTFRVVATNSVGAGPAAAVTAGGTGPSSWPLAGRDLGNTRNNPDEHVIGDANVSQLQPLWSASLPSNLTGTPSVVDGVVYLPDRSGTLSAYDAATGAVRWSHTVSSFTGVTGDSTRNTAVAGGRVIFGDRPQAGEGARLTAVSTSGTFLWSTVVDAQSSSVITGAATIDGNVAYIGVSSREEEAATCCSFRGSVVAVDVSTGAVLWKTYTAPVGYTGNAVWSSAPVVDHATGLLYVGTGNNYTVPAGVCEAPGQTGCTAPAADDYVDALLALHLDTGAAAWVLSTLSTDVSSHVCSTPATCGPDFDFGSDPNLFTATIGGVQRQLLGIGQKSGVYWAVDAVTGALVWQTRVGPGGGGGGIQWGSATDGLRIYVAEVNSDAVPWSLVPSGVSTTGGFFSALDPATGAILWQTADPQGAQDFGYVSVANGVVYAGSGAGSGTTMYALDARHGAIKWSYASGGSVMGGAAIVDGRIYWASGYYTNNCPPTATTCGKTYALYSFGLPPG